MDLILIAFASIVFLLVLFIVKSMRKHMVISVIKLCFFFAITIVVLILLSSYFSIGEFFSRNSLVVQTGAAVVDAVKSTVS